MLFLLRYSLQRHSAGSKDKRQIWSVFSLLQFHAGRHMVGICLCNIMLGSLSVLCRVPWDLFCECRLVGIYWVQALFVLRWHQSCVLFVLCLIMRFCSPSFASSCWVRSPSSAGFRYSSFELTLRPRNLDCVLCLYSTLPFVHYSIFSRSVLPPR